MEAIQSTFFCIWRGLRRRVCKYFTLLTKPSIVFPRNVFAHAIGPFLGISECRRCLEYQFSALTIVKRVEWRKFPRNDNDGIKTLKCKWNEILASAHIVEATHRNKWWCWRPNRYARLCKTQLLLVAASKTRTLRLIFLSRSRLRNKCTKWLSTPNNLQNEFNLLVSFCV